MPEFDQQALMTDDDQFCTDAAPPGPPEVMLAIVQFGEDADTAVLRLATIDLAGYLRRQGVPQSSARQVATFQKAWNTASASNPLDTGGKYTRDTQAALDAALSALSPETGSAPQAIL